MTSNYLLIVVQRRDKETKGEAPFEDSVPPGPRDLGLLWVVGEEHSTDDTGEPGLDRATHAIGFRALENDWNESNATFKSSPLSYLQKRKTNLHSQVFPSLLKREKPKVSPLGGPHFILNIQAKRGQP